MARPATAGLTTTVAGGCSDLLGCFLWSSLSINSKRDAHFGRKLRFGLLLPHCRNAIISSIFQALLNPQPLDNIAHLWCSKFGAHVNGVSAAVRTLPYGAWWPNSMLVERPILFGPLKHLPAHKTCVLRVHSFNDFDEVHKRLLVHISRQSPSSSPAHAAHAPCRAWILVTCRWLHALLGSCHSNSLNISMYVCAPWMLSNARCSVKAST